MMIIASVEGYRKRCRDRLPRFLYDYISGGSYEENTLRANIADLQAIIASACDGGRIDAQSVDLVVG